MEMIKMEIKKELFGKVFAEYDDKPQFTLEFYITENYGSDENLYGIQIDKFNSGENIPQKSESSGNVAGTRKETENIIKSWIDDLFWRFI